MAKRQLIARAFNNDTKTRSAATRIYSSLDLCQRRMDYVRGWAWQQVLLQDRLDRRRKQEETSNSNDHDVVMLLEHNPVYTLGRGADEKHLTFLEERDEQTRHLLCRTNHDLQSSRLIMNKQRLQVVKDALQPPRESPKEAVDDLVELSFPVWAPNSVPIYRVERGGEVTFHGPGQLVVYPMLDLAKLQAQDLHVYLRKTEQVVIDTLQHFGITATRNEANTGVWIGNDKIAAVGVSSSRWITMHGFAINVNVDLNFFDASVILPCGVEEGGVTSIETILSTDGQGTPSVHDVAKVVLAKMEDVFGITLQQDWSQLL